MSNKPLPPSTLRNVTLSDAEPETGNDAQPLRMVFVLARAVPLEERAAGKPELQAEARAARQTALGDRSSAAGAMTPRDEPMRACVFPVCSEFPGDRAGS